MIRTAIACTFAVMAAGTLSACTTPNWDYGESARSMVESQMFDAAAPHGTEAPTLGGQKAGMAMDTYRTPPPAYGSRSSASQGSNSGILIAPMR